MRMTPNRNDLAFHCKLCTHMGNEDLAASHEPAGSEGCISSLALPKQTANAAYDEGDPFEGQPFDGSGPRRRGRRRGHVAPRASPHPKLIAMDALRRREDEQRQGGARARRRMRTAAAEACVRVRSLNRRTAGGLGLGAC
eukprot:gene3366-biopygen8244